MWQLEEILSLPQIEDEYGIPFEWDRSWRIRCGNNKGNNLNINAMQQAAMHLEGTHDFTKIYKKLMLVFHSNCKYFLSQ